MDYDKTVHNLQCPKCHHGMEEVTHEGIAIDRCTHCKGLWFDEDEAHHLKKLEDGVADATLLAAAGLNRLGMSHLISSKFSVSQFPPAPGQGAICIESRIGDQRIDALLEPLNDKPTKDALRTERAFLRELDGSCRTPLAGHAVINGDHVTFHGMILSPDGKTVHEASAQSKLSEAEEMAIEIAGKLRKEAGSDFFADWATST